MPQPFAVHISVAKRFTVGNVYCRAASFFLRQHYFYFCRHLFHQMYIRGFNNTQRQPDSILSQTVLHFICDIVFRFVSLRFNIFLWKFFSLSFSAIAFSSQFSFLFSSSHQRRLFSPLTAKRIRCMLLFLNSIHLSKHWTFSESYIYTQKHIYTCTNVRTYGKRVTKITSNETKSEIKRRTEWQQQ